ncbi:MAG TPA: hypothetical protein VD865_06195 [Stenotrophomonas sp.]|nr:hypothetical protein [Stenotrophomonas sp.]
MLVILMLCLTALAPAAILLPATGRASDILDTQNPPPRPADELVNLLAPRAEAGDRQAASQLYLVLSRCRLLARDMPPAGPAQYVDPVILARQQESAAQFLARLEWNTLNARAKEMKACGKVPATRIAQAGMWLQRAASAGDPYARLIYADRVEDVVGGPREMLANPQKLAQFKSDAMAYLQELSAMGSVEAMSRLGSAYQNGVLVGADPVMAYAYGLAAARTFGTAEPDVTTQRLESQLTPAELGRARLLADGFRRRDGP